MNIVAEHFHITVDDIKGSKRNADVAFPRQVAMYLCNTMTQAGLKKIGSEMGNRDHTTVLHGFRKIDSEIKKSESTKDTIDIIKKKINPN